MRNFPKALLVNAKMHEKVVLHMTFKGAKGQVCSPVKPTRVALEIDRCRINQQSLIWPSPRYLDCVLHTWGRE